MDNRPEPRWPDDRCRDVGSRPVPTGDHRSPMTPRTIASLVNCFSEGLWLVHAWAMPRIVELLPRSGVWRARELLVSLCLKGRDEGPHCLPLPWSHHHGTWTSIGTSTHMQPWLLGAPHRCVLGRDLRARRCCGRVRSGTRSRNGDRNGAETFGRDRKEEKTIGK